MPLATAPYIIATHAFFFRNGDTINSVANTVSRERTANVAKLVTAAPHGFVTGSLVTITGIGAPNYNAAGVTITVVDATSFTYPNTGTPEATAADTDGVVTQTGTAGRMSKPGANDANWVSLGVIEDSNDTLEPGEAKEVWRPSPGKLILFDQIRVKPKVTFKFTCGELSPFHVEVMYRTLKLDSTSTQWNPMEGVAKQGWLKLQRYDHNDQLRMVLDHWVELSVTGDVNMGGNDPVKPQFEAVGLYSPYNTGTL